MRFLCLLFLCSCSAYQWKLKETNDYFTFFNKDSDYTQGLELEASSGNEAWAIGQDIYTPVHKRETPPRRDERPYAGYLYLSGRTRFDAARGLSVGLKPGWIGPWAGGKMAQCGIHSLLGQDCPVGWEYQIGNRPALQGTVKKEWNYEKTTISAGANAGTPTTSVFISTERILWSPLAIDVGSRLEAIAYDSFLDAGSSAVTKRPYRCTAILGARWKGVRYFLALQTPATKESHEAYNYGGIEITW